jgi:hypothetical protein
MRGYAFALGKARLPALFLTLTPARRAVELVWVGQGQEAKGY